MEKFTGKSIDDVLEKIASEKQCQIKDIVYNVIEEKKGILGLGNSVTVEAYTAHDVKEFIFDYLGNFFMELNQEVAIEIIEEPNGYKVILDAENNAIIIGKAGQTLHAVNTVLKGAVNSYFKAKIFVMVDINNYKVDRYAKVKRIAQRVARNVKRTKIDAALDPMPNDERKVIHQYLTDMPNIKTESSGEGRYRHLVIKYVKEKEEKECE
ncbi:MAG: R3H domain-containing nucleic acid-binding protein [Erysipelotrichaceae bacterium]